MYHAVQVAASDRPHKTTTRQMLGHFKKANVPPKRIVKEFPVTPDAHVPIGEFSVSLHAFQRPYHLQVQHSLPYILYLASLLTLLRTREFAPSLRLEMIVTTAYSIGKGFQGGMKRWGFKGLKASHGVSVSHRSSGSAGNSQVRPL